MPQFLIHLTGAIGLKSINLCALAYDDLDTETAWDSREAKASFDMGINLSTGPDGNWFFRAVGLLFRVTAGILAPIGLAGYGIVFGIVKQRLYFPAVESTQYGGSNLPAKLLVGQSAVLGGIAFVIGALVMHLFFFWSADKWRRQENPISVRVLHFLIGALFLLIIIVLVPG